MALHSPLHSFFFFLLFSVQIKKYINILQKKVHIFLPYGGSMVSFSSPPLPLPLHVPVPSPTQIVPAIKGEKRWEEKIYIYVYKYKENLFHWSSICSLHIYCTAGLNYFSVCSMKSFRCKKKRNQIFYAICQNDLL